MPILTREPKSFAGRGLLRVQSNSDLERERKAADEARALQFQPVITSLAGVIGKSWETARFAREKIEQRMLDCLRRRSGEYSPDKMAAIRATGGSEIFMMLTSIKCRAAESWISDIEFPPGDSPWDAEPTEIPEVSPDLEQQIAAYVQAEAQGWMQQNAQLLPAEALQMRFEQLKDQLQERMSEKAREIATRMKNKITDQFEEGGWEKAVRDMIKAVVTYPSAFIKGPVIRKRKSLRWIQGPDGKWLPQIGTEYRTEFYSPSPFDIYPSPSSKSVQDGWLFERHRLRRSDLAAMKGVPGYDVGAINLVLDEYGRGGLRNWLSNDQTRADLEGRPNEWLHQGDTIDALECWGSVSGEILIEWGLQVPDPHAEYEISAWKIGNYIIRAALNESPTGERPYDQASFEEIPGSIWGKSVPEIMADVQDVCNAAARSLINNMAITSGPQVEVHADRLAIGEEITNITPWRVWQTTSDPNGTNNPAVRFSYPNSIADVLMKVYEFFSSLADEYTNIPKYSYGENPGGGAAGTASGLSMLMSSAARGIKQVISALDVPIAGTVRRTYIHNMLYGDDESIKGDLKVNAKGARSLVAKEQQMVRRQEFLNSTNNPVDMQIIGVEGRAELLREAIKSFEIDADDIVPDKETLQAKLQQAMQQQLAAQQVQPGRTLDQAGNPVSGQDTALFNQRAA